MMKLNKMTLMTRWLFLHISQWMRIGGPLSERPLLIPLEHEHLVRSQLTKLLYCLRPSVKRPTTSLQLSLENTIQKLLRLSLGIWHQSLPTQERWPWNKLKALTPLKSALWNSLVSLYQPALRQSFLLMEMAPMCITLYMAPQPKEPRLFWLRKWSGLETLTSNEIQPNANFLPMASIQLVRLHQKPVDSHPTLKSSPERFWGLAKALYLSRWQASTLEDINIVTHKQEAMMKYNACVESMVWLEVRRNTRWLDLNTPQWLEPSFTTKIKLENPESSMDALTEIGLPIDYFAPPMMVSLHICPTWTIWRRCYCESLLSGSFLQYLVLHQSTTHSLDIMVLCFASCIKALFRLYNFVARDRCFVKNCGSAGRNFHFFGSAPTWLCVFQKTFALH